VVNNHDREMFVLMHLEATLESINSRIPKEEFEVINNTPKHLQLLTDEDIKPKSP